MPHLRFHNGESFYSFQRSLVTAASRQFIINIGQLTDSREQRDILAGKTLDDRPRHRISHGAGYH